VNICGVSTLAIVAIQKEMHVIALCNSRIYSPDYDCSGIIHYLFEILSDAQLYLVKSSSLAYFVKKRVKVEHVFRRQ